MTPQKNNLRFGIIALMIVATTFSRLIPHPWNFTPIGAMALFGAAYFSNRFLAFAIPLIALWLGDIVLNNTIYSSLYHNKLWLFPESFPWYYLGFVLVTVTGFVLLKQIKFSSVIVASLSASVVFFLLTNFGSWIGSPIYSQNLNGLLACYGAGIPFFGNTILGDLFFTAVLFGTVELAKMKFPKLVMVRVK